MKNFIILFLVLFCQQSFAGQSVNKLVKKRFETSRFSGGAQVGIALVDDANAVNFIGNFNLRYAVFDKLSLDFDFGKYLVSSEQFSTAVGRVTQSSFGFSFAITGYLARKTSHYTFVNYKTTYNKRTKKKVVKNRRVKLSKTRNLDGFRIGFKYNDMEFSKFERSINSFTTQIYYEQTIQDNITIQYGLKYNRIDNALLDADLIQGFIGISLFP